MHPHRRDLLPSDPWDDIPTSFVEQGIPQEWSELWLQLTDCGWYCVMSGAGPDWQYMRPHTRSEIMTTTSTSINKDFFQTPDKVREVVERVTIHRLLCKCLIDLIMLKSKKADVDKEESSDSAISPLDHFC